MEFSIPEDILREAGLTEREALVEFACRLFQSGRIELPTAARLAGLERLELERALTVRGIAVYCPTVTDLCEDLETIKHLDRARACDEGRITGVGRQRYAGD